MIKQDLVELIRAALNRAQAAGALPNGDTASLRDIMPQLDVPKQKGHGDYATNIALILAGPLHTSSREIAQVLAQHIETAGTDVERVDVAGPGFINFYLTPGWLHAIVKEIAVAGEAFGKSGRYAGRRVLVEFVSANPNGPITVAHGRGGAIGDALASLLAAVGYSVEREFYVNDALNSTQMNNFGKSVHFRYMQALGVDMGSDDETDGPDWLYRGEYVLDIAQSIIARVGDRYVSADIADPATVHTFRELAQEGMQQQQIDDLKAFGITFDSWFLESALHDSGSVMSAIEVLKSKGFVYELDGALWLRTTDFGDDKDRVVLRANGAPTYIAGDIAYHKQKFDRGFDRLIDIWGADHGGYVARTKAAVASMGYDADRLDILLFQLVRIMKNGEMVRAAKRKGNVLELKADLIDEIGKDAARFFFLMRSSDASLDIDLDLAKEHSAKNPVYYVQYAHARACRVLEKAKALGIDNARADLSRLTAPMEIDLMKSLGDYPDQVAYSADHCAPHAITTYVRELASAFHLFYDAGNNEPSLRVLGDNAADTCARLHLVTAAKTVLSNALTLLGLESPEAM